MQTRSKRMPEYLDPFKLTLFNQGRHREMHRPKVLHWTSTTTLEDDYTGSRIYVLAGKLLLRARISVQGAPSGDNLDGDILIDGQSAFSSIDSKLLVADGATIGRRAHLMGGRAVPEDSYVQCKITVAGGATGPAVFEIEYLEGSEGY